MPYKNHVISTNNERLTSGFRPLNRPNHDGMDFTDANRLELKQDVHILAFEDGVVVRSEFSSPFAGMGNYIDIRHEFNGKKYLTRYCHFKSASPFKTEQTVKKGDVIGVMGTTGNSTGIHLHFGLKENSVSWNTGTWVNPEPYLSGAKSMRAVEPVKGDGAIKVGDIVQFTGGAVYMSSDAAIPVHSRGKSKCKVTQTRNAKHPHHLISEDGVGVYGWVDLVDIVPLSSNTTNAQIIAGDKVKIKSGATYYTGGVIPAWVVSDTWIVASLNGDRAVLGMNVSGKNSIMSPINVKDLTIA